ncbi:hypothetical protein F5888DRAFT_1686884 [Russula emetica]|nr:hypothetical protein F5888DRAFT_1686884 [Russula emetica]
MSPTNLALSIDSNIRRADPTTIKDKFLVGYQGWFYCQGDGEPVGPGHHGWIHWFTYPVPHGGHLNTDYWPDTSQYTREELFVAPGFKHKDGSPAHLFSSRNPKTVQRHFHWMAEKGVDGVFLQRFLGLCDVPPGGHDGNRRIRDEVGDLVQRAAEREGRVYAIMYDVSGVPTERIQEIIEKDWNHLLREKRVLNSPNCLRENGKPVIALWGFGFNDRNHSPELVRAVTSFFRNSTPGGAYIMAGAPAHWRTSDSDADRNPEFVNIWMECFDAISPWTVGRYSDQTSADAFAEDRIQGDVMFIGRWATTHGKRVDYVPVVHPGGSGYNLSNGQWGRNAAPREGGRFLWRQIYNARKWGARIMYGAMWDEYDEGTQFLPAITRTADLPHDEGGKFALIACDIDGYDLPPDWYMRIAGYGSSLVKDERNNEARFPEKVIREWEPKHEVRPTVQSMLASGSGNPSSGTNTQRPSYRNIPRRVAPDRELEDPPPPPYTRQAEGSANVRTVVSPGPEPPILTRPDIPRGDSRPPPPVPPRPSSQVGLSPMSHPSPGAAPAIPLASRPSANTPPHSPHSPGPPVPPKRGPSPAGYHGQPPSLPHHLSANQPAPMESSPYPHLMPMPQMPSGAQYQMNNSGGGLNSYTSPFTMPQPGNPSLGIFPNELAPVHAPPPGQHPGVYSYEGGYDNSFSFPEAPRPSADYRDGYSTSHTPPFLEPQQLNPGLPPPLSPSRESPTSTLPRRGGSRVFTTY